jgi:hypothetical protein
MPRKPRNTKRGSEVLARRKRKEASIHAALTALAAGGERVTVVSVAKQHALDYYGLCRRWRRYKTARDLTGSVPDDVLAELHRDGRGGHNRTFTTTQELELRDIVARAEPAMGHQQIVDAALQLRQQFDVEAGLRRTRTRRPFRASDGFVTDFKRRQRLSSHRSSVVKTSKAALLGRDLEEETFHFLCSVRMAIVDFGPHLVMNMDETPVKVCDAPLTGVVPTGCGHNATIRTAPHANQITSLPCITAGGDSLPLTVIVRGKTARSLQKISAGNPDWIRRVHLLYSQKGWSTRQTMWDWLWNVVLPYTKGRPAALILDSYAIHFTDEFISAARLLRILVIQVPAGLTSTLQPLDVCFNGPMLKARQRIWREMKQINPFLEDSPQNAVARAARAYDDMPNDMPQMAFRKCGLID